MTQTRKETHDLLICFLNIPNRGVCRYSLEIEPAYAENKAGMHFQTEPVMLPGSNSTGKSHLNLFGQICYDILSLDFVKLLLP